MPYLFQASLGTVPVWLAILLAVIAASGTWLTLFVNRKRRSSRRAEDDKLAAEARNLDIQSLGELHQLLRETRAELAEILKEHRARAEENRRQQGFLRDQVLWHEEVTTLARQAAHAAINEIQRCMVAIKIRDQVINEAKAVIPDLRELPPFEQTVHEEIVKYQEFPLPPLSR